METVVLQLAKLTATVEALSLDVAEISQINRAPTERNAQQCKLPISKDFMQLNEDLRDEHFQAKLVRKPALLMHDILTPPLYIYCIVSLIGGNFTVEFLF